MDADRRSAGAALLVKIGALGGLTSTMVVMLLGQSRVLLLHGEGRPAAEMFFPTSIPKFRTPWISSITVGLVVAIFASHDPARRRSAR